MHFSTLEISTFIAISAACVSFVSYYFGRARERRIIISKRHARDLSDIYRDNFYEMGIDETRFIKLWKEIADILEVPAEKLLPTDRFDVELAPPGGYEFNDPINDVKNKVAKYSNKFNIDARNIISMRDYISAFGRPARLGE